MVYVSKDRKPKQADEGKIVSDELMKVIEAHREELMKLLEEHDQSLQRVPISFKATNQKVLKELDQLLKERGPIYFNPIQGNVLIFDDVVFKNTMGIRESGIRAARSAKANPRWFESWSRKELPKPLTESHLTALMLFKEQKEKEESTWSAKCCKGIVWLIGGMVLAFLTVLVAWAMGLFGLK